MSQGDKFMHEDILFLADTKMPGQWPGFQQQDSTSDQNETHDWPALR